MWVLLLLTSRRFWIWMTTFIACLSLFVFQKSFGFTALLFLIVFLVALFKAPEVSIVVGIIWLVTSQNDYSFGWIADTIEFLIVVLGATIICGIWWALTGKFYRWYYRRKAKKAAENQRS